MLKHENYLFAIIYSVFWEGFLDAPNFYLCKFLYDEDKESQMLMDDKSRLLACTDAIYFPDLKAVCQSKYSTVPNPFELGEDRLDVLVGSSLALLRTEDRDSELRLYQTLALLDDVFRNLEYDHKGCGYEESVLVSQMRKVRIEIMEEGTVSEVFKQCVARVDFVAEVGDALRFLNSRIRIISGGQIERTRDSLS